jgi:hypothetical protein
MMRFFAFVMLAQVLAMAGRAQQNKMLELMGSKATGLEFSNEIRETEALNVLAYEYFFNGGGVAAGDINNDGLTDLYFSANMKPNKLFLNLGDLHFKDITKQAGQGLAGRPGDWKTGVTMADVNNDGLLDIYLCYSGRLSGPRRSNELFINLGGLKFAERAADYGIADTSYTNQAAFFDYDLDGDLDLFLLNHSLKKVDNLEFAKYRHIVDPVAGCKLFENKGEKFVERTQAAGIQQSALTFGLGVVVADINMDGWPDLYVTNDYNEPDHLYLNKKNGRFADAADSAFTHMSQFSMGADIADFNNDALPDLMTLDMLPEDNRRQKLLQLQENYEIFELMQQQGLHKQYMRNMLQLNNGNGSFSEIGQLAGVAATDWSWTPVFADLDNDGWKDIMITNGYLRDYTNKDFLKYWGDYKIKKAMDREPVQLMDLVRSMPSTKLPNYVFRNNANLKFANMQAEWGMQQPSVSSAAVCVDLDNDGDLEIVINNINEEAFLYKNHSRELSKGNFLALDMRHDNNAPAVGAKAWLYVGGKVQYQEVGQNRGYLSCASTRLHFGLASSTAVDSIIIQWPGKTKVNLMQPLINQLLTLKPNQLNQSLATTQPRGKVKPWFVPNAPIAYKHQGFAENDFKRQPLMLSMYSQTGPVLAKADVNKDGYDDLFVSGGRETAGKVWLQNGSGEFSAMAGAAIVNEQDAAVSAATFADVNGDGWPDLYVAKGGYSIWMPNTPALQDELWLNDGKGKLVMSAGLLPDVSGSSKSCVRATDYDGDGDIDFFVGGRVVPGRYPISPTSYLLVNNGAGKFESVEVPFKNLGMVTDAVWHDWDGDGRPDLLLAGEMMPLTLYLNKKDQFEESSASIFSEPISGFWSSLALADVNQDGKMDLIAGNLGENVPFKISPKQPAELVYADFDKNGSVDPFFNFYLGNRSYPYVSRDELNEQIYAMRKKFTSYALYADAQMTDIIAPAELESAARLTATEQRSMLFVNTNGMLKANPLPVQAQFANARQIVTSDFNGDGHPDILLLGNQFDNRLKMGAISANQGCVLAGDGKGNFSYVPQTESGLRVLGEVKTGVILKRAGKNQLVIGANNQQLQHYEW